MAKKSRRRIKFPEVIRKTGSTKWTVYRWMEECGFPRSHKLDISPDNLWWEDEVDAWLDAHTVEGEQLSQAVSHG